MNRLPGVFFDSATSQIEFKVFSKNATCMHIYFYADKLGSDEALVKSLSRYGDIWSVSLTVEELRNAGLSEKYILYGYRAWGPNWVYRDEWHKGSDAGFICDVDSHGNRFNPNKLLIDPYAREISHDPQINRVFMDPNACIDAYFGGDYRYVDTGRIAPKSVFVLCPDVVDYGLKPKRHLKDDIIYEVNVRGFTMLDESLPQAERGTFKGAGKKADYLSELGVTAVEFLPVQEFADEQNDDGDPRGDNYWGYMTLNYFSPNRRYSSDKSYGGPTREFKEMVKAFHDKGIKVFIDVVYNHTGEGLLKRKINQCNANQCNANQCNINHCNANQCNSIQCNINQCNTNLSNINLGIKDLSNTDQSGINQSGDILPRLCVDAQKLVEEFKREAALSRSDDSLQDYRAACILSYAGLDNSSYYFLREGGKRYEGRGGCGGNLNYDCSAVRNLIFDSLKYWAHEMGVDGFRFDLAPILSLTRAGNAECSTTECSTTECSTTECSTTECSTAECSTAEYSTAECSTAEYSTAEYSIAGHPNREKYLSEVYYPDINTSIFTEISRILPSRTIDADRGVDLIAEPWGEGGPVDWTDKFPADWSVWNRIFRDTIKTSMNKYGVIPMGIGEISKVVSGSQEFIGKKPWNSINYIVSHDDTNSLRNVFSYNAFYHLDEAVIRYDQISWDQGGDIEKQLKAVRNAFALLLLSAGTPMFAGGDELLRGIPPYSKGIGLMNLVAVDNEGIYLDFRKTELSNNKQLKSTFSFVKNLIRFRKMHECLRPFDYFTGQICSENGLKDITWYGKDGNELTGSSWQHSDFIAYRINAANGNTRDKADGTESIYIAYNRSPLDINVTLPHNIDGKTWNYVTDTFYNCVPADNCMADDISSISPGRRVYVLHDRSILVMVEK